MTPNTETAMRSGAEHKPSPPCQETNTVKRRPNGTAERQTGTDETSRDEADDERAKSLTTTVLIPTTPQSKTLEPALVKEDKATRNLKTSSNMSKGKKEGWASIPKATETSVSPATNSEKAVKEAAAKHVLSVKDPASLPSVTPPTRPREGPSSPSSPESASEENTRRGVPHTYDDYSMMPDPSDFVRKKTGGVTQPFPEKLHELLSAETDVQDVVCWLPHGRAFVVRNPKAFTTNVMPKYFRQSKLTSFQRQLNLYGFRRLTQGPDQGAYYHELFLKGRPQLCMRMVRQKVKGTGHKQPADVKSEPNFYVMPSIVGSDSDVAAVGTVTSPSPGLHGIHRAANLLQGISAGLPPSAWTTTSSSTAMTYSTASLDPQHCRYKAAFRWEGAAKEASQTAMATVADAFAKVPKPPPSTQEQAKQKPHQGQDDRPDQEISPPQEQDYGTNEGNKIPNKPPGDKVALAKTP